MVNSKNSFMFDQAVACEVCKELYNATCKVHIATQILNCGETLKSCSKKDCVLSMWGQCR